MALRRVAWIVVAIAGCKSGDRAKAPAAGSGSAGSGSSAVAASPEPRIPSGPVPVRLPVANLSYTRRVGSAQAFVTISPDDVVAYGVLDPGAAPYAGTPLASDASIAAQVDAAIAGRRPGPAAGSAAPSAPSAMVPPPPPPPPPSRPHLVDPDDPGGYGGVVGGVAGGTVDPGADRWGTLAVGGLLKIRGTFDVIGPLDVMVLADAGAHGHALLGVLVPLVDRRLGLAVDGTGAPDALVYRFGQPRPYDWPRIAARVRLTVGGVLVRDRYGTEQSVAATSSGGVDRAAVSAAITDGLDPYADSTGSQVGQVVLSTDAPVQTIIDVLAALAAAKLTEVELVDNTTAGYGGSLAFNRSSYGYGAGTPKLTLGDPYIGAGLDKAVATRTLKRHAAALTYCYEKELLAKPDLTGSVTADLIVAGDGRVTSVTVSGIDDGVNRCLESVLRGIEFPAPRRGDVVEIVYPLTFEPTGG